MNTQTIPLSEVAAILGVSRGTVYEAIRRGDIEGGHVISNRYVVNRQVFEAWWNGRRPTTTKATALRVV